MHFAAVLALVCLGATQILAKKQKEELAGSSPAICPNYFLKKDHCLHGTLDHKFKCAKQTNDVKRVTHPSNVKPASRATLEKSSAVSSGEPVHSLQRRYDDSGKHFVVAPGNGVCGPYKDSDSGVCLWSGDGGSNGPSSAGWLSGAYTKTCGRKVFVKRTGPNQKPVYATVVDGCSFGETKPEPGCFRIAFTNATFYALNPTAIEKAQGIKNVTWDFIDY